MRYLVRVGAVGSVGRFSSREPAPLSRGSRVVCRTTRGLEIGEVLVCDESPSAETDFDGELLRKVAVEDDLLLTRLRSRREDAYDACTRLLSERGLPDVLLDVETTFDGRSLYFYFLGDATPECQALTDELAATYEAEAKLGQFAETLEHGCGPGCGTEEAAACGTTGGCQSCSLVAACKK